MWMTEEEEALMSVQLLRSKYLSKIEEESGESSLLCFKYNSDWKLLTYLKKQTSKTMML